MFYVITIKLKQYIMEYRILYHVCANPAEDCEKKYSPTMQMTRWNIDSTLGRGTSVPGKYPPTLVKRNITV